MGPIRALLKRGEAVTVTGNNSIVQLYVAVCIDLTVWCVCVRVCFMCVVSILYIEVVVFATRYAGIHAYLGHYQQINIPQRLAFSQNSEANYCQFGAQYSWRHHVHVATASKHK